MTNTNTTWKFQHEFNGEIAMHTGNATDARGLRLRADCGYTHVKMEGTADDGWLQIAVAIRKVEARERMAVLEAKIKADNWPRILADNITGAAKRPATRGVYRSGKRAA
jgi:hypothetical protein